MPRTAKLARKTKETNISLVLNLDGTGESSIATSVGFFDHMLTHLAKHSLIDLAISAKGDTHIDDHHTVEDVSLVLGSALDQALGDKIGIFRYGWASIPMEDTLASVALDLSGRPAFVFNVNFPSRKIKTFDVRTHRRIPPLPRQLRQNEPPRQRPLRQQLPPHRRSHLQSPRQIPPPSHHPRPPRPAPSPAPKAPSNAAILPASRPPTSQCLPRSLPPRGGFPPPPSAGAPATPRPSSTSGPRRCPTPAGSRCVRGLRRFLRAHRVASP